MFWGWIGGVESENALGFAELALVLEIFLLLFFIILLEHGAFSRMRSFFNIILFVFIQSLVCIYFIQPICISIRIKTNHNIDDL